jgi:hypothetical protein
MCNSLSCKELQNYLKIRNSEWVALRAYRALNPSSGQNLPGMAPEKNGG